MLCKRFGLQPRFQPVEPLQKNLVGPAFLVDAAGPQDGHRTFAYQAGIFVSTFLGARLGRRWMQLGIPRWYHFHQPKQKSSMPKLLKQSRGSWPLRWLSHTSWSRSLRRKRLRTSSVFLREPSVTLLLAASSEAPSPSQLAKRSGCHFLDAFAFEADPMAAAIR